MMCSTRKRSIFVCALLVMMLMGSMTVLAAEGEAEYVPDVYATFWALVPPIVAIGLALITKEVYSSLFVGILMGGLLYSGFTFEKTFKIGRASCRERV